jgi:hypothetical protein
MISPIQYIPNFDNRASTSARTRPKRRLPSPARRWHAQPLCIPSPLFTSTPTPFPTLGTGLAPPPRTPRRYSRVLDCPQHISHMPSVLFIPLLNPLSPASIFFSLPAPEHTPQSTVTVDRKHPPPKSPTSSDVPTPPRNLRLPPPRTIHHPHPGQQASVLRRANDPVPGLAARSCSGDDDTGLPGPHHRCGAPGDTLFFVVSTGRTDGPGSRSQHPLAMLAHRERARLLPRLAPQRDASVLSYRHRRRRRRRRRRDECT